MSEEKPDLVYRVKGTKRYSGSLHHALQRAVYRDDKIEVGRVVEWTDVKEDGTDGST